MFLLTHCKHTASLRGILACAEPSASMLWGQACICHVSTIPMQGADSLFSCVQNLQPVISQLLTLSNTTEQRDGRRDTAFMLARKRGLEQVVNMLLTAGATDLPSSYSTAGCRAWAPGIYAFHTSSYIVVQDSCQSVNLSSKGFLGCHDCCQCKKKAQSDCRCGNALQ